MDLNNFVRRNGNAVVLSFPEGRSEDTRRAFNDLLRELVREGLHHRIVIDLSQVTWFSSLDLGGLVFALRDCREKGLNLSLAAVPDRVTSVLAATKMDAVFQVFPTVEDAIA